MIACPSSCGAALCKKGRFYERSQYFVRSADRGVHNPAAPVDAQAETTSRPVGVAEDVRIMRIDHVSIQGKLHGVWRAPDGGRVFDFKELNRRFAHVSPELLAKDIKYEKHEIHCESKPGRYSCPSIRVAS